MLLELDAATIIFEIVNFLVLVYLLHRFFFRPVMQRVQQRADEKMRLLEAANEDRAKTATTRVQLERELTEIDQRADEVVAQAREQMETERMELMEAAREESERIRHEAETDAASIRQQAIASLQEDIVDTVLDVSSQVIGQAIPSEAHNALVKQLEERVWELGRTEMHQVEMIRRSLQDRSPTVYITTAHMLTPEQQRQLAQTFSALADRDVNQEIEVDSSFVVGLRIRLGDIVMDNSLAGKLEDLRDNTLATIEQEITHG